MNVPRRGEVWYVDFEPVRGHEQGGHRPALVLSEDIFNRSPAQIVVVLPITTRERGVSSHVRVDPPEGGLKRPSFVKCEDVRSVDQRRLTRCLGAVAADTMSEVEELLRLILGL